MADRGEVINAVLHHLGETESAAPLSDKSEWVRRVRDKLPSRIKACLSRHPGNFCTSIELLSRSEPDPPGWDYAFDHPGGAARCLKIIKVTSDGNPRSPGIPYKDSSGRIFTNHETTWLEFVDGVYADRFGAWPQPFADYVAVETALHLCPVTESNAARRAELKQAERDARIDWKAWDARQGHAWEPPPSRWQRARFQGSSRSSRENG